MSSPYFHIPDAPYARCQQIVSNAINAWHNLVIMVAAENLAMGITVAGKTQLISDAFHDVMLYGSTGSLWEAHAALDKIIITPNMAPFITEERRTWMKNQLISIIASL